MIKNVCFLVAICGMLVCTTGCYTTVGGNTKMGVPGVKDNFTSRYQRSVAEVREATRKVFEFNGTLTGDDLVTNTLTAIIDTRTVYVRILELEDGITEVITQVRTKNGGRDLELAAEIDKQIALRLPRY